MCLAVNKRGLDRKNHGLDRKRANTARSSRVFDRKYINPLFSIRWLVWVACRWLEVYAEAHNRTGWLTMKHVEQKDLLRWDTLGRQRSQRGAYPDSLATKAESLLTSVL